MCTPVLKVCPECGAEIDQVKPVVIARTLHRLQVPARVCPVCGACLDLPAHAAAEDQARLPGVA